MGLTLDFSKGDYKEAIEKFKPLAPGNYPVVMAKFEEGIAKSSGDPKVTVYYTITDDAPVGAGKTIIKDYSLGAKAVWRWTNDMVALGGVDADDIEGNAKVNIDQVCRANVTRKGVATLAAPDEGFNNNKLDKIRPLR